MALDGLERGARLQQKPVQDLGAPVRNESSLYALLANGSVGVKHLESLENPSCVAGGALDVYAVTGNPDDLWRRMIHRASDSELRMAETRADGRRVRFLYQIGDDYLVEVALTEGRRGTVLATRGCS